MTKPRFHEYFIAAIPAVIGIPIGIVLLISIFGFFPGLVVLWLSSRPLVKLMQRDVNYEIIYKDEPLLDQDKLPWMDDAIIAWADTEE